MFNLCEATGCNVINLSFFQMCKVSTAITCAKSYCLFNAIKYLKCNLKYRRDLGRTQMFRKEPGALSIRKKKDQS